jgi:hypothetical protein
MIKSTMSIRELIDRDKPKKWLVYTGDIPYPPETVLMTSVMDIREYEYQYFLNTLEIYL